MEARGTLYWSAAAEICCKTHAPHEGSDTWLSGKWERMDSDGLRQWRLVMDRPAACEVCGMLAESE